MEYEKIIELLKEEKRYAKENYIPIMRDRTSKLLYDYISNSNMENVLEIGTAIGYSGSIMLLSNPNVKLQTVDINEKSLGVASNTFKKLGIENRVQLNKVDAKVFIDKLLESSQKFDFILLDGPKGQYINYLNILKNLLNKNGLIFADNIFLGGMVESNEKIPHRKRTMVVNLRKYLEEVKKSPFETEIFRIEDGVAITKIRES